MPVVEGRFEALLNFLTNHFSSETWPEERGVQCSVLEGPAFIQAWM